MPKPVEQLELSKTGSSRPFDFNSDPAEHMAAITGQAEREPVNVLTDRGDEAEILISAYIGDGEWSGMFGPRKLAQALRTLDANRALRVVINSPGGYLHDGAAMGHLLQRHAGAVTGVVSGVAASAATLVAMGADKIKMYPDSSYLIHRVSMIAWGNRQTFADALKELDMLDNQLAERYAAWSGKTVEEMANLMAEDRLVGSAEANELGLVDELLQAPRSTNTATHNPAALLAGFQFAKEQARHA